MHSGCQILGFVTVAHNTISAVKQSSLLGCQTLGSVSCGMTLSTLELDGGFEFLGFMCAVTQHFHDGCQSWQHFMMVVNPGT